MSAISVPLSVPVKVQAQDTNISFTQNEEGYFMNLDLKLELPLQDLVDSLMMCGDKISPDGNMAEPSRPTQPDHFESKRVVSSESPLITSARNRDQAVSFDTYYSVPFPRFDSPYRKKGKWQTKQATFFMKDTMPGRRASPAPTSLSADAPVFTPMTFASVDSIAPPDLWELPGLPSPLMEPSIDPPSIPARQTSAFHSILQRGLSSALMAQPQPQPINDASCRQM